MEGTLGRRRVRIVKDRTRSTISAGSESPLRESGAATRVRDRGVSGFGKQGARGRTNAARQPEVAHSADPAP